MEIFSSFLILFENYFFLAVPKAKYVLPLSCICHLKTNILAQLSSVVQEGDISHWLKL